jgi:hypothetical protein
MLPEESEVEGREDKKRIMNSASSGYLKAQSPNPPTCGWDFTQFN